jgi:hypothetical protein
MPRSLGSASVWWHLRRAASGLTSSNVGARECPEQLVGLSASSSNNAQLEHLLARAARGLCSRTAVGTHAESATLSTAQTPLAAAHCSLLADNAAAPSPMQQLPGQQRPSTYTADSWPSPGIWNSVHQHQHPLHHRPLPFAPHTARALKQLRSIAGASSSGSPGDNGSSGSRPSPGRFVRPYSRDAELGDDVESLAVPVGGFSRQGTPTFEVGDSRAAASGQQVPMLGGHSTHPCASTCCGHISPAGEPQQQAGRLACSTLHVHCAWRSMSPTGKQAGR